MTAPLVTALNLKLKGVPPNVRLASLIVLGQELYHLKQKLGYLGIGSWQSFRDEPARRPSWERVCKTEAGITDDSATNYRECGEAVKNRLRWAKFRGAADLLEQMEKVPSELSTEQRTILIGEIARMIPDSTQTLLRNEFRAARPTSEERKLTLCDPAAAARLDEKRRARVMGVMTGELRRTDPEALARLALKAFVATRNLHLG